MTQTWFKHPLENWWYSSIIWVMVVAAWFGIDRLYKRKTAAKTYHGAALVLQGWNSAKHQEVLAAAIVWARGPRTQRSETAAIFIQKIREWIDYNTARGKRDARPYYSYQEWCDHHFPAQNFASMQRLVLILEDMGLISTEQDADQGDRKRYAVNEIAIKELVSRWTSAFPEVAKNFQGESPRLAFATPRLGYESERLISESHTSSKKAFKSNALSKKNMPSHLSDAARFEPLALTEKSKEADTTEPISQSIAMDDTDFGGTTPPSSATPPVDDEAAAVWKQARAQLSFKNVEFKRWLEKAVLRSYACIDGIATYRVAVPTAHAQDQLQHRYYRNVAREFLWRHDGAVKIEFEVDACHTT